MPYKHPDAATNAQITAENDKILRLSHVSYASEIMAGMVQSDQPIDEGMIDDAWRASTAFMIKAGLHKEL